MRTTKSASCSLYHPRDQSRLQQLEGHPPCTNRSAGRLNLMASGSRVTVGEVEERTNDGQAEEMETGHTGMGQMQLDRETVKGALVEIRPLGHSRGKGDLQLGQRGSHPGLPRREAPQGWQHQVQTKNRPQAPARPPPNNQQQIPPPEPHQDQVSRSRKGMLGCRS